MSAISISLAVIDRYCSDSSSAGKLNNNGRKKRNTLKIICGEDSLGVRLRSAQQVGPKRPVDLARPSSVSHFDFISCDRSILLREKLGREVGAVVDAAVVRDKLFARHLVDDQWVVRILHAKR